MEFLSKKLQNPDKNKQTTDRPTDRYVRKNCFFFLAKGISNREELIKTE